MSKIENLRELLSHITTPLSKENIELLYKSHYVVYERCDLYKDFVLSLINLVFDTYMGDDVTKGKQKNEHFNWCWNKTINNFMMEDIHFAEPQDIKEYFEAFMFDTFYSHEDKLEETHQRKVNMLWKHIFNYHKIKTRSDVDTLIDVYEMFEKSLKKGKKLDF